ncbi:hypothetical protein [Shimia ponticola]|uniref:hypothetical protein n=1 Tax=Shimia ponticola TaxID=2582893 RepID=UPI0011BF8D3F|nr:hypothetical protein [Shimia ponticola]
MEIRNAIFHKVTRDRDFGRVEAVVTLRMQYHPALPPVVETVLASVPARRTRGLRQKLINEASRVATLLRRSDNMALAA